MRARHVVLALGLMVAGCGEQPASAPPARADPTARLVASVERALRRNPNQEASSARCRGETGPEVRRSPFGGGRPVLRCSIALRGAAAEPYDVQVLGNCFVGERVRAGRSDYGCGVLRVPGRK